MVPASFPRVRLVARTRGYITGRSGIAWPAEESVRERALGDVNGVCLLYTSDAADE